MHSGQSGRFGGSGRWAWSGLAAVLAACGGGSASSSAETSGGETPVEEVPVAARVGVRVFLGERQACALLEDGTLRCWGASRTGGLGISDQLEQVAFAPVAVDGLTDVTDFASGLEHACAVRADGSLHCAGVSNLGQRGAHADAPAPRFAAVAAINDARAVACGLGHTCVLRADGGVSCAGAASGFGASTGETCTSVEGDLPCVTTFSAVPGIAHARAVAAGAHHTCVLLADGTVSCSGSTGFAPVAGLAGVVQIAAAGERTCAVLSDASVQCWGADASGPQPVEALTGATSIAVGEAVCGIVSGAARCGWIAPRGTGEVVVEFASAPTGEVPEASSVATAGGTSCVVTTGGEVRCWGSNEHGTLGDPRATRRDHPVRVLRADGTVFGHDERVIEGTPPMEVASQAARLTLDFEDIAIASYTWPTMSAMRNDAAAVLAALGTIAEPLRACLPPPRGTRPSRVVLHISLDGLGGVVAGRSGLRIDGARGAAATCIDTAVRSAPFLVTGVPVVANVPIVNAAQ